MESQIKEMPFQSLNPIAFRIKRFTDVITPLLPDRGVFFETPTSLCSSELNADGCAEEIPRRNAFGKASLPVRQAGLGMTGVFSG